jgi:hypothetical protein
MRNVVRCARRRTSEVANEGSASPARLRARLPTGPRYDPHARGCRYRNRHDAGGQAIPRVIPGVLGHSEQIRRHRSRFSNKSALLSGDGRRRHRRERARLWLDLYDSATEDGNNAKGRGAYARSAGTCATTCCQDDLMFDIKRRDRQRGGSVAAPGARTAAGPHAAH